jgi:hypothetical protein
MWWDVWKKRLQRDSGSEAQMSMTATTQQIDTSPACPHPNEVDCKRIERALAERERYRYVSPRVYPIYNGYRVESPCCSRNIDKEGGVIDIAQIEYLPAMGMWRLYRKDHSEDRWESYAAMNTLWDILDVLKGDPLRMFWP